ncbi:MAG TPA: response regulator [Planctomycetes bacterium]|nr:response regulator [Planctomycetota bacterium]
MTKCFDLLEVDGKTLDSGFSVGLREIGDLLGGKWSRSTSPFHVEPLGRLPSQGGPLWKGYRLPFRTEAGEGRISLLFDQSKVLDFLRIELDCPKDSPVFSPLESLGLLELSNFLLSKLLEHCGSLDLQSAEFGAFQPVELGPRSPSVDLGVGIQASAVKDFGEQKIPVLLSIAMGGREEAEFLYYPRNWGGQEKTSFRYSEDGWLGLSKDLRITAWNPKLKEWTGLGQEEAVEEATENWFHWLHRSEVRETLERSARLGVPAIFTPFLHPSIFPPSFPCGSTNHWRIQAFPQATRDAGGSWTRSGYLMHFRDFGPILLAFEDYEIMKEQARAQVEELCRAQAVLEEEKEKALEADRAKAAFFSNLCHEVRTPLNHLLGELEILGEEDLPPSARKSLEKLQEAGMGLEKVFQGLMDFARLASGKTRIAETRFPLQRLLEDLREVFEKKFLSKGLAFRVENLLDPKLELRSDYHRIRQILVCLLENAYKFTENGGIQVRVLPFEGEDYGLRLEVLDTGCGVPPEARAKIFLPFFQAEHHLRREYGGNGVGLSLAQGLAEMLGGRVSYGGPGEDGIGSCFVLDLPHGENLSSVASHPAPAPAEGRAADPKPKNRAPVEETPKPSPKRKRVAKPSMKGRILIVDDCMDNQRLFTFFLRKCGIQVATANNGRIGMDKIHEAFEQKRPFDLVLMDIQMPEMDGYEATRKLREEGYKGVIVALTAHSMEGDRERCLEVGCDDYETKPIGSLRLLELVQKHIGTKADRAKAD